MRRPSPAPTSSDLAPDLPPDVGRWLAYWAARRPAALAWADDSRRCSFREADERVARLATWLARHGVRPGERVALWLANRGAVLEAVFACARLGAVALPINARLTPNEVAFQLSDSTPRVLLVERVWRDRAQRAIDESGVPAPACLEVGSTPLPLGSGGGARGAAEPPEGAARARAADPQALDAYEAALASVEPHPPEHQGDPEDPMILMYTSGTTGLPKGALLPHRKTLYNCLNARACFAITHEDRVLVVAPLFHSLGLQILALPAIACGASVVIQEGFDPQRVWRAIVDEGISYLGGVPTAHQRLLDALEGGRLSAAASPAGTPSSLAAVAPRLRFLFTAGAAAPTALIRAYHRHGLAMIQGYGQTETSLLTCLDADHALAKAGSVGRPLPYALLRIIDAATLDGPVEAWRDVGPGAVGEVVVRGPITMLGYWKRPEATRETLRGEWLRTGDLATRDEAFDIALVGRAREMYISGGENVYPAEVEAALVTHPDVAEAAVVAIPDPTWGEVGRAHLVARAGASLDLGALSAWLATRLARFKQPREFVIEASLPRTASGKVQKHRLAGGESGSPR